VQRIIRAYDEHKTRLAEQQLSLLEPKPGVVEVPPSAKSAIRAQDIGAGDNIAPRAAAPIAMEKPHVQN
jgi:hypothetical protein